MLYVFVKKDALTYFIYHNDKKIGEMHFISDKIEIWYKGQEIFRMKYSDSIANAIELCAGILLKTENAVTTRIDNTVTKENILKEVQDIMELVCLCNNFNYLHEANDYRGTIIGLNWLRELIKKNIGNVPNGFCPITLKKLNVPL